MCNELVSRFLDLVATGLHPLDPVTFIKHWRHLFDSLLLQVLLELNYVLFFKVCDVIPTEEDVASLLGLLTSHNAIFLVWNPIIGFRWRDIHSILLIVAFIVRVINVRVVDRLSKFFEVLLVCKFLVEIARSIGVWFV